MTLGTQFTFGGTVGRSIELNSGLNSGEMAIALGHEFAHTQQTAARNAVGFAGNEILAWNAGFAVLDALSPSYKQQATSGDLGRLMNYIKRNPEGAFGQYMQIGVDKGYPLVWK